MFGKKKRDVLAFPPKGNGEHMCLSYSLSVCPLLLTPTKKRMHAVCAYFPTFCRTVVPTSFVPRSSSPSHWILGRHRRLGPQRGQSVSTAPRLRVRRVGVLV